MKKLILSSVAVLALSFAGNANTIKEEDTAKKEDQVVLGEDCNLVKYRSYANLRSAGLDHETASGISYRIYFQCMSEFGNQNPIKPIDTGFKKP